jgi:hypothetical protein
MERIIHVRSTQDEVFDKIAKVPNAVKGGRANADTIMLRIGVVVLECVKKAFTAKSHGRMDEAGLRWKPLSPKTVAYNRHHGPPKDRAEYRPSFMLTDAQRDRWWAIYRQQLARFRGDKSHAARVAWAALKASGAKTMFGRFGHLKARILYNTEELFNSLRVFRAGHGEVFVGTTHRAAAAHHNGVPGRLPQRRLWPEPSRWPASWWRKINSQFHKDLVEMTVHMVEGGIV